MSRANSDEQFHFLISCIRHSNNGKVDFTEVAKECNIVSKGAAAKRYERMMKAHGINPNGGPAPSSPGPSSASTSPAKGREGETTANNNGGKDGNDSNKKAGSGKQSPGKRKTATGTGTGAGTANASSKKAKVLTSAEKIAVNTNVKVKEEGTDTENTYFTYRNRDPLLSEAADGHPDEAALFKEFCNTGENSRAISDGQFEVVAPSNVNDEDEDADGDEDNDVTVKEEPGMA